MIGCIRPNSYCPERSETAALEAGGHQVLYYENTEGGHAGASNNAQAAFESAVIYEFLLQTLFQ